METRLPAEVELAYEVMSCQAVRIAQEPGKQPHPCSYFRKWGTYHSYDYTEDVPAPGPGIVHKTRYVGRAPLVPELLSGCRKAPLMALGINPNLPGWWPDHRGALNPLFDDYRQYAHYFRYRAHAKLELSRADYERFGGGDHDTPFSDFELEIPENGNGNREIEVSLARQKMYDGLPGPARGAGRRDGLAEGEARRLARTSPTATWSRARRPSGRPSPTRRTPRCRR